MAEFVSSILEIIRVDFFITFGIYSILFVLISLFSRNQTLRDFDESAVKLLCFLGLLYFFLWITAVIVTYPSLSAEGKALRLNRMFGPYWYGFWLQSFLWVIVTQLLRIEKLKLQKVVRVLFGILLIFTVERFIIVIPSLSRGFIPSTWNLYFSPTELILGMSLKLLLFVLLTLFYKYLVGKIKLSKLKANE